MAGSMISSSLDNFDTGCSEYFMALVKISLIRISKSKTGGS